MKFLNIVPWAKRSVELDQAVTRTNPAPVVTTNPDQPATKCNELSVSVSVPASAMAVWNDMAEKKRRRCKSWRPSLDAISETAALRSAPASAAAARKETVAKKNRGKSVKVKGRVSIYSGCDDLRHFGSAAMMPSFSPPAFLF